ncbi:MAG: amidohydrolase family protein [bacterium]|nr:amidohydrolase family protein [bacterium]
MARIIFTGANLVDGKSAARRDATIVVEDDRITSVGDDAVKPGPGDRLVELNGDTLMPGMHTCHYHASYQDYGLDIFPIGIDQPGGVLLLRSANAVRSALMTGFTSIVGAGGGDDIDAQLVIAIEEGIIPGPRILPCSRDFGTRGGYIDLSNWWWKLGNTGASLLLSGPDEFRDGARNEMKRGAQMIKMYVTGGHGNTKTATSEYSRDELEAVVRTVHERGRLVRAHCAWKSEMLQCIELGVDVIDHGDEIDDEVIAAMVEAGTFLVPSALFLEKLLGIEELRVPGTEELIETTERELENLKKWVPRAQKAGVRLLLGDDYGAAPLPHGNYTEEMEFYVKHFGISPLEIIRWATVNGAELEGVTDELGTVEEGKLADLLVVNGDPSVDISVLRDPQNLRMIMKGGELVKDELPAAS